MSTKQQISLFDMISRKKKPQMAKFHVMFYNCQNPPPTTRNEAFGLLENDIDFPERCCCIFS